MGDEQGDRPTPFLVDWTDGPSTHHRDQLDVGRYTPRDFKMAHTSREGGVVLGKIPKIEGSIGFLIGQRAKHFGLAFAIDLRIPESGRFWVGCWLEICFSKDCSIIPLRLAFA